MPPLLNDEKTLKSLRQIYVYTCIGGDCLLTMHDCGKGDRYGQYLFGICEDAGKRYFVFQVRDFEDETYNVLITLAFLSKSILSMPLGQ